MCDCSSATLAASEREGELAGSVPKHASANQTHRHVLSNLLGPAQNYRLLVQTPAAAISPKRRPLHPSTTRRRSHEVIPIESRLLQLMKFNVWTVYHPSGNESEAKQIGKEGTPLFDHFP